MNSLSSQQKIFHVSNRLTFGTSMEDIDKINKIGVDSYVAQQLNPKNIELTNLLASNTSKYKVLQMNVLEIFKRYNEKYFAKNGKKEGLSNEEKARIKKIRRNFLDKTLEFKVDKSINNPHQLQEVMTDFWFNHFNVFVDKLPYIQRFLINNYEQKAIQTYSLGKFRDLLQATAEHPSMLYYLDNWQNVAPNPKAKKSSRGLNENYARELMELHTLGVNGGYTQNDVISLARILTGWGVMNPNTPQSENGFYFNEKLHDYEDKVFLGNKIKGSGIKEVYQALDILAYHPSTANHISYKLAQFFVTDNPPNNLVKKLAKTFTDSEGNIKIVLTKLFESEEFWDAKYYGNKFKTPLQYVISTLRIANIKQPPFNSIIATLRDLEMTPYYCVTPNGYKNNQEAWLSPDGMIKRLNFATKISQGRLKDTSTVDGNKLLPKLDNFLSNKTINTVKNSEEKWQSALILGSPEMIYK
jgi:uncharacterized protein (DUF1800 family)